METLNIEAFNPTVAQLQSLTEESKAVDTSDIRAVKEVRIKLKSARVEITKRGKAMRDDANAFAKAVIAKEKELVAIIEPEEDRLKEVEEQAEILAEMKKREKEMPERLEQLSAIGDGVEVSDEEILKMDSFAFGTYVNTRKGALLDKMRLETEERERVVREAEEKAQREKEIADREEKARVQERERIELEKVKKEAEEKAEQERLEKQKSYQKFLADNGYTEATKDEFRIIKEGDVTRLFKLVATYK